MERPPQGDQRDLVRSGRAYRGGTFPSVSAAGRPSMNGTGVGRRTAHGTGSCVPSRPTPTSRAVSTGAWSASTRRPAVPISTRPALARRSQIKHTVHEPKDQRANRKRRGSKGGQAHRFRHRDPQTPQRSRAHGQPAQELPSRRHPLRQEGLPLPRHRHHCGCPAMAAGLNGPQSQSPRNHQAPQPETALGGRAAVLPAGPSRPAALPAASAYRPQGRAPLARRERLHPPPPLSELETLLRQRLKAMQYRHSVLGGFLAGTGLAPDRPNRP
ncbi:hypothetical protein SBADM41S_08781 [Streptomyces badius]